MFKTCFLVRVEGLRKLIRSYLCKFIQSIFTLVLVDLGLPNVLIDYDTHKPAKGSLHVFSADASP